MTKRTGRTHNAVFEAEVALAAVKGERTLLMLGITNALPTPRAGQMAPNR